MQKPTTQPHPLPKGDVVVTSSNPPFFLSIQGSNGLSSCFSATRLCFIRQKKDLRAPVDKWGGLMGASTWTPAAHTDTALVSSTYSVRSSQVSFTLSRDVPRLYSIVHAQTDAATDLLAASMRRWRGNSEDDSCSFTLLMSLGWMKSNKLCPVSSDCECKWHAPIYTTL